MNKTSQKLFYFKFLLNVIWIHRHSSRGAVQGLQRDSQSSHNEALESVWQTQSAQAPRRQVSKSGFGMITAWVYRPTVLHSTQRSGAVGACEAHNLEVVRSKLTFATKWLCHLFISQKKNLWKSSRYVFTPVDFDPGPHSVCGTMYKFPRTISDGQERRHYWARARPDSTVARAVTVSAAHVPVQPSEVPWFCLSHLLRHILH